MPDLEGKLSVFDASAVLQMLNLLQATGELMVNAADNTASIFIDGGNITFAAIANRPMRLGEALLKEKLISKSTLNKILKKKSQDKKLGMVLVEEGVITESDLQKALVEQIKEVIYEVVRWRQGMFFFEDGRKAQQEITINVPPDQLMLEGMKRMDEERDIS